MIAKGSSDSSDTLERHTVDAPRGEEFDLLDNRWEIHIEKPIADFSNELCKAYAAHDRNGEYGNIYALVGYNSLPFRDRATEVMQKGATHHLKRCHATGPVTLSSTKITHRVFIFQRPAGKKLGEIIKHAGPLPEGFIVKQVVVPLARMIMELEEHGINHGCINPSTIFFEKEVTAAECGSLPSGYLQLTPYEAPDRLLCMAGAKGAGDISCDFYALGILALQLYLGYLPHENIDRAGLIEEIIAKGAYNVFIPEVEFPDILQDLLRGTITENRLERWNSGHMKGWIGGKRYTVVAPSIPKDSVRPFDYRKKQYFTRQSIAYTLSKDWAMAKGQVSGFRLMRWLESNIKKTDVCAQVDRIIPIADDDLPTRALKDDELSRLLSALDPQSPIRYQLVSLNTDAIGPALAEAFRNENEKQIRQLILVVEHNLLTYADRLLEGEVNPVTSTVLWRLQNLRPIMKAKSLGFGAERLLYQLNPSLCCQQGLLASHYVYTLEDVLVILDKLSAKHAKTGKLVDRHVAAFLTNRLELNREVKVVELSGFGDLAQDERLIMLKILSMAQQKIRNKPLYGLTQWATEMVTPILDNLHQTSKREKMKTKVQQLVEKGMLERIAFLLFNKEMFAYDEREYNRAQALFRFHSKMLSFLKDNGKLRLKARVIGQQSAWFMGIIALGFVVYSSSRAFM